MAKTNLHPLYCPGCRKDLGAVTDVGRFDRVHHCGGCQNYYRGAVWAGKCPVCGELKHQRFVKTLDPNEAVPGDYCSDCTEKQDAMDQAVKDGGIRFQCTGCGCDGVFASATPFAQRVREEVKKPAPQDVFVQIKTCPQCPPVSVDPSAESELVDLLDDETEFAKKWDGAVDYAAETDTTKHDPVHEMDAELDGLVNDILSA